MTIRQLKAQLPVAPSPGNCMARYEVEEDRDWIGQSVAYRKLLRSIGRYERDRGMKPVRFSRPDADFTTLAHLLFARG